MFAPNKSARVAAAPEALFTENASNTSADTTSSTSDLSCLHKRTEGSAKNIGPLRVIMLEAKYRDFIAIDPANNLASRFFGRRLGAKIFNFTRTSRAMRVLLAMWVLAIIGAVLMLTGRIPQNNLIVFVALPYYIISRGALHTYLLKRLIFSFEAEYLFMLAVVVLLLHSELLSKASFALSILIFCVVTDVLVIDAQLIPSRRKLFLCIAVSIIEILRLAELLKDYLTNSQDVVVIQFGNVECKVSTSATLFVSSFFLTSFGLRGAAALYQRPYSLLILKSRLSTAKVERKSLKSHLSRGLRGLNTSLGEVPLVETVADNDNVLQPIFWVDPALGFETLPSKIIDASHATSPGDGARSLASNISQLSPGLQEQKVFVLMARETRLYPQRLLSDETILCRVLGIRTAHRIWAILRSPVLAFSQVLAVIVAAGVITLVNFGQIPAKGYAWSSLLVFLPIAVVLAHCNYKIALDVARQFETFVLLLGLLMWVVAMFVAQEDRSRRIITCTTFSILLVVIFLDSAHPSLQRTQATTIAYAIGFAALPISWRMFGVLNEDAAGVDSTSCVTFTDMRLFSFMSFMVKNLFNKIRSPDSKVLLKAGLEVREASLADIHTLWTAAHQKARSSIL